MVKVSSNGKETILKADRNLFSIMALISQSRNLGMKTVLSHPLGPSPWALATSAGTLRKTNKAVLGNTLEKLSQIADIIPSKSVCIIDAMSIVQKTKGGHTTFEELSAALFRRMLIEGGTSERIDVIFDVYREKSIKNIEREKRGANESLRFKNISGNHKIQQ